MELASSPMTERQRKYRATYRDRIAGWYNGWLHAAVIAIIGATALTVYIANIANVRWWEWLIVPITFLFANFLMVDPQLRDAPPFAGKGIPGDL